MLNENQHKILALPNIQELIKALDCEVVDNGEKNRKAISNRVEGWLSKTASLEPRKRIISTDGSNSPLDDKSAWIQEQRYIHGQDWSPF